jgi:CubicO group peptidase (beta-lactamase class C family)
MKRTIALVAVVVLAAVCAPYAAETAKVKFPDTDAGKRVAGYINAFNGDNEKELRAFLEANISPESLKRRPINQRMQTLAQLKADVGALEAVKIIAAREDAITLIASSANGKWLELSFEFENNTPHKLMGVRLELLDEAPDLNAPPTPLSEAEIIRETERTLDDLVAKDEFSGVVLLAKGGSPVFRKAYGLASKEFHVPNLVDTRFNLGSINKFITRIAIEQLAGKQALSYDDKIGKYLPDYPNKEAREKVTIRHLLDMTSGVGDFFGEKYVATPKDKVRTLADYLPFFADEPLHFEPGSRNEYSNGGYIVLGLVIERASGGSYFDYVRENIYEPAGMVNTAHFEADNPVENVSTGYTRNWDESEHIGEPRRSNFYTRPARGSSAGGGYSTVDDLLRLVLALGAGKLSAPEAAASAGRGIGLAGGAPGISAFLETDPRVGYTLIVLSNYDPPTAEKAGQRIGALLRRLG